jgi:diamine N-acetyltransferase
MEIIKATSDDVYKLQKISVKTFSDAFAKDNTPENLKSFLDFAYSINKLSQELFNPESEFYFAKTDGKIVGYIKLNFGAAQTEIADSNSVEVERIYVEQELHGAGVGKALLDKAIAIAQQRQADYIWLGVWEKNPKAIRFYEKNGFVTYGSHKFMIGEDNQTDILMKLQLK